MYYVNQFLSILELIKELPSFSHNKPYLATMNDSFDKLLYLVSTILFRISVSVL